MPSKRMVLHVVCGIDHRGGVSRYVEDCLKLKLNYEQLSWRYKEYPYAPQIIREGRTRFTDQSTLKDIMGALLDFPYLLGWCKKSQPTLLHAHSRMGIFASLLVQKFWKKPVVIHLHAKAKRISLYRSWFSHPLRKPVFNSARTCLHFGFNPHQSAILTPFIKWPKQLPLRENATQRFIVCGSILPWKRVHLIIEAFNKLSQLESKAELHIFGASPISVDPFYQDSIIAMSKTNPAIVIHSFDPEWTQKLFHNDIFVHAAMDEPFGIVLLEAFAFGLKMIIPANTFLQTLPMDKTAGISYLSEETENSIYSQMVKMMEVKNISNFYQMRSPLQANFSDKSATVRLQELYDGCAT